MSAMNTNFPVRLALESLELPFEVERTFILDPRTERMSPIMWLQVKSSPEWFWALHS